MRTIDLTKFGNDGFVLHFGGRSEKINATSFSKALFYLIQATEIVNDTLCSDSETDVEVSIKSVKHGSLSVILALAAESAFGIARNVISQVISGYILKKLNARELESKAEEIEGKVTIKLELTRKKDRKIIEHEVVKVTMDKEAMNLLHDLESNRYFNRGISRAFKAMLGESNMDSFDVRGLNHEIENFSLLRSDIKTVVENIAKSRKKRPAYKDIRVTLGVRIPVLENTRRKWEFTMDEKKIMASIVDDAFLVELESGKISIKHGDEFKVLLRVFGKNEEYEVIEVSDIISSSK